jgi:hypothetical protein
VGFENAASGCVRPLPNRDNFSRLGVRDTKQAEKAKSQLAKIRRQTVGLTKDEFHDKVRALMRRTATLRELTS